MSAFSALLAMVGTLGGCASDEASKPNPALEAHQKEISALRESVQLMGKENKQNVELLAALKAEVQSLRERVASTQRMVEVVRRGTRSGLFSELPGAMPTVSAGGAQGADQLAPDVSVPGQEGSPHAVPKIALPHVAKGRVHAQLPSPGEAPDAEGRGAETEADDDAASAQLVADARLHMRRGAYGEAVVALAKFQKDFPDAQDGGESLLLLAECWQKLGQGENALPPLRTFFLKHPQSPDTLKAKMIEGRVYETQGARERAGSIYREVLALGPESVHAREARAALSRLRDMR